MAFLFHKFQEAVKILAKSPTFARAREARHLQFEADINLLFLYTSYNRLGRNADEADAEEIIDMANKASLADQRKQVHENVHSQVTSFCGYMNDILLPDHKFKDNQATSPTTTSSSPENSGLGVAVGQNSPLQVDTAVPETKALQRAEVSQRLKDLMGYTLEVKPSQIPHEDAGKGLFLHGEANIGSVVTFYPGVVYSPASYPRIDAQNSHLITRYDGTVINAQPWGVGGESREIWDWTRLAEPKHTMQPDAKGSDGVERMLSKPLDETHVGGNREVLERRNPLAFAHFANHPAKGMVPNVMVCPYDFPLLEKDMRAYIPNVSFGNGEETDTRRLGSFRFKPWKSSNNEPDVPVLRTLVFVATRAICDEEVLLNYRLSNSEHIPSWYTPVEEED
ncbi:PREDICTED: uncharacterized protein LOC109212197 [Nicotiana attenuata]|uniref:SET domain-containing protein n=1 Tax=Nicotiana attenuata TaxID=49451 RepID=A0A314KHD4_NICAT|nr:PREDICTED: uncharacterized protein LOC109212197 [Nicotiana attenuata]OIT28801.1 hypothetical protein A4A49_17216 [Nicotiana attenuata]